TGEVADQIVADLSERGRIVAAEEVVHRYPHCWRCQTPLIFRLSEDWFIAVDEARARSRPTPRCAGRRTTWAGGWTTGCTTWTTGTSRVSASTVSPSPSTRAR